MVTRNAAPPRDSAIAAIPWVHLLVLATLTLGGGLIAAQAGLIIDSGRDLANAWEIAQGRHWPLLGPSINGNDVLGPLWFYLLAVPFALGASTNTVILLVAAASAMKYPLAYLVGNRWRDPATGLFFALALAIPGWLFFDAMVFSHTAIVASAILLMA